jgi:DNA-binding MarR family transcriptional regulator
MMASKRLIIHKRPEVAETSHAIAGGRSGSDCCIYTSMATDASAPAATCQTVAESSPCFALRKASRAVTQLFDEALRPSRLHSTQFTLMVALRLTGAVGVSRLAEELVTDASTLSRNLAVLERRGLVAYSTANGDRRVRRVSLTVAGNAALARALPAWEEANNRLRATVTPPESADLLARLDVLTRAAVGARRSRR